MKVRYLVSCILLSILMLLLLSSVVQATEYREVNTEVKADDILKHIENGEDINLTDCHIVGELNPLSKLLNEGHIGLRDDLLVKSNIKIEDSFFENSVDFSNFIFNGSIDFSGTTFYNNAIFTRVIFNSYAGFYGTVFYNSAYFDGATFYNDTNFHITTFKNNSFFSDTIFYSSADFRKTNFNNYADFSSANFNYYSDFRDTRFNNSAQFFRATLNYADFVGANFNNSASFRQVKFLSYTKFRNANFNNSADFSGANFNNSADFSGANFNNSANFVGANFNNYADFLMPDSSENITTDGKACEFFRKSYNIEARYTDADNIYYNFRLKSMYDESISISKLIDFLSWVTCGFGTKLEYTISWIIGIVILFAFVYKWDWKTPGIYRSSEEDKAEKSNVSFWECLCFSVNTFTRLGTPNWSQGDNFWSAVTFEGVLGWIMLAIFLATLMHLLIRP